MAIREQITQAQDAQEKQRLTAEYRVLEKKVADLQKQAQGGTAGAGEVEAQVEEKALPGAGIDDQLALPQGDTAQKGEPAEQAEAKKSEKKALEDSLFDFGDNKEKESDEAGEVKPVLIECHVCGATNVVSTSERPAVVECSSCGEQGYLAE